MKEQFKNRTTGENSSIIQNLRRRTYRRPETSFLLASHGLQVDKAFYMRNSLQPFRINPDDIFQRQCLLSRMCELRQVEKDLNLKPNLISKTHLRIGSSRCNALQSRLPFKIFKENGWDQNQARPLGGVTRREVTQLRGLHELSYRLASRRLNWL